MIPAMAIWGFSLTSDVEQQLGHNIAGMFLRRRKKKRRRRRRRRKRRRAGEVAQPAIVTVGPFSGCVAIEGSALSSVFKIVEGDRLHELD
jgi:hypothetical protein